MRALRYQYELINEIYNDIVILSKEKLHQKITVLFGDNESGKTFILKEISKKLINIDIDTHYISVKENSANAQIYTNNIYLKELKISPSITTLYGKLQVDFAFIFDRQKNYRLKYLQYLSKLIKTNNLQVFVFDDFTKYDENLQNAIVDLHNKLLKDSRDFHFIFGENTSDGNKLKHIISDVYTIKTNTYNINDFDKETIKEISERLYPKYSICNSSMLDSILNLCNNSLKNIISIIELVNENNIENFENQNVIQEIMNHNYDNLIKIDENIPLILKIASIIQGDFDENLLNYICSMDNNYIKKTLNISAKKKLIKSVNHYLYDFTLEQIRNYFLELDDVNFNNVYYNKYLEYILKNDNGNYYMRAHILNLCCNDNTNINYTSSIFSYYLMSLVKEYEKNKLDNEKIINICKSIEAFIYDYALDYSKVYINTTNHLKKFYHLFNKKEFIYAKDYIMNADISSISDLFDSHVICIKLYMYIKYEYNRDNMVIKKYCDKLYSMNENLWSLNEYNQWLNVSITLLSIYTNNLDDANKSIIIWNNIENNLKYFNNNEYMDLIQILYRRAALYEPPTLAVITSYKSVIHFRKQDCKEELFLSLCNYGANLITTGQYKEALLNLHEANNIYEQENLSDLFSDDRLFLNIQIAKYMEREENILCLNKSFNKSEILNNVIATIDAITKYIETHDNIHCLYHVNLASLYAMLQMEEQYLYHINLVAQMSDKDDTFYSFYSDNIKLSYYILTNNYEKASELYKLLILNPYPTLFMNSDKHLHNRMDMINKIVNQEIECTNIEDFMDNMLAHCKNKIGNYSFFYRPFLLTDFQYLSQ